MHIIVILLSTLLNDINSCMRPKGKGDFTLTRLHQTLIVRQLTTLVWLSRTVTKMELVEYLLTATSSITIIRLLSRSYQTQNLINFKFYNIAYATGIKARCTWYCIIFISTHITDAPIVPFATPPITDNAQCVTVLMLPQVYLMLHS